MQRRLKLCDSSVDKALSLEPQGLQWQGRASFGAGSLWLLDHTIENPIEIPMRRCGSAWRR